jgi:hypothetical protein
VARDRRRPRVGAQHALRPPRRERGVAIRLRRQRLARVANLLPETFVSVQTSIRGSGILDASPEYRPGRDVIGGSLERWTVELDGRQTATLLRVVPDVHDAAVSAVADALHEALVTGDRALG